MEPVLCTPRLKLTLITKAERGSQEFEWLHELRSDEKAMRWSVAGRSKTLEDTEKVLTVMLPPAEGGDQQIRRVAYAVHELLDAPQGTGEAERPTRLVGLVNLMSAHGPNHLVLPEHLTIPASEESTTLVMELAYMLLPAAWGKGFAAEAVIAVFGECKNARAFWAPYEKVWVRAIVNAGNPASLKVMAKTPMREKGIYEWNGGERKVFLAGQWTNTSTLHIWGMHLLG